MREIRGQDCQGAGHWQAPRGERKHNGIDYICDSGDQVIALKDGLVTKIGYPYNPNDTTKGHLRYVEVTDNKKARVRYFYIKPKVKVGDKIRVNDILGISQDLTKIYPGITQHYHLEVIGYINPEEYL